jgi:hypothetical protein
MARAAPHTDGAVSRRALLLLVAAALGACASANGYDPSRYTAAPEPLLDPEVEPLKPSPKRRMRDPRGVPVFDAGVLVATAETAEAGTTTPIAPAVALVEAGAAVGPACGSKADPCPMQRFMRAAMETAHTADTLTSGFTLVAGMSPDPEWAWVAIATRGADLANAGEIARAKAQCVACHDSYRERYRARYRGRPL